MSGSPPPSLSSPVVSSQPASLVPPPTVPHKITIVKGGDKSALLPLQMPLSLGLVRQPALQGQIVGTGGSKVTGTVVGSVGSTAILQGTQIISQGTQGGTALDGQGSVRTLPTAVRLLSPISLQQHPHLTVPAPRSQNTIVQTSTTKQLTSYHVPRGPAAVANLSVPRATAAPRAPAPTPLPGWTTANTQLRPGAVVYSTRQSRPYTITPALQFAPTQRPATIRPSSSQSGSPATVVARAIRPISTPSQRTPSPQVLQTVTPVRTTTPKVVPLVQKSYQPAKVVGVTLGVGTSASPRPVAETYYYEVSGNVSNTSQTQNITPTNILSSLPLSSSTHSLSSNISSHATVTTFAAQGSIVDTSGGSNSPPGPQRPSILRKRDNEGSPIKSQWSTVTSPPPSPGGSTTVSAASSPELDEEELPLPSVTIPPPQPSLPTYNNCSPRKKPRKQLLSSDVRGAKGAIDCEFPSENVRVSVAPSPPPPSTHLPPLLPPAPPETEKPPRRALLSAGWTCGWRATAFHFMRPTDVKKREERRPSVVELAAQKHVLQKAKGWKIHHLTAQMDDLVELESSELHQATETLKTLEGFCQPDLDRICELLKGNIQRSKIVCEGVTEAKNNVLRIFHHTPRVSDILARQADKRCFKKHRTQY